MNNATKIWLIIGSVLIVTGIIIFSVAMTLNHWNFKTITNNKYVTTTHEVSEDFSNISLDTDTADVIFIPSDDKTCKVVCYELTTAKHSVSVNNDSLTISLDDRRKWYDHIGLSWSTPTITVYLPKADYNSLLVKSDTGKIEIPKDFKFENADIKATTGNVIYLASASGDIKIKTSTGNIRVENTFVNTMSLTTTTGRITVNSVECDNDILLKVSTGNVKANNIRCNSLSSDGSTGYISLENVIASDKIHIERSTGNIDFEKCDAAEIYAKTTTGHIYGSLLSEKIFITESTTGNISVPKTTTGGKCELKTTTGNIKIKINQN